MKDAILEERVSFDTSKSTASRQNLSDKKKVQMMLLGDASRSKSSAVSVPTLKTVQSDKTVTSSSKPRQEPVPSQFAPKPDGNGQVGGAGFPDDDEQSQGSDAAEEQREAV